MMRYRRAGAGDGRKRQDQRKAAPRDLALLVKERGRGGGSHQPGETNDPPVALDPAFRQALSAAEGEVIDVATRRLPLLQGSALDTFEAVLGDATVSAGVRLRAAQAVPDHPAEVARAARHRAAPASALRLPKQSERRRHETRKPGGGV